MNERFSHDEVVSSVDGGDETEGSDESGGSVAKEKKERRGSASEGVEARRKVPDSRKDISVKVGSDSNVERPEEEKSKTTRRRKSALSLLALSSSPS